MTSRKIQKSRSGSYLVSLPKSWVEESGLEKGDRINMKRSDGGVVMMQLSEDGSRVKFSLNIDDFPGMRSIENVIKACYMQGGETIEVKTDEEPMIEEKERLRSLVLELIGSEIYMDRPGLLAFRVLVDPTKFSIPNLFQRVYNLIDSVHEDAINALKNRDSALVTTASKRGEDAKRLYRLMIRELKISAIDSDVAEAIGIEGKGEDLAYTIAARDLSRMAHHAVRFAEVIGKAMDRISEQDVETLLEMSNLVKEMEEKSFNALLQKDISKARGVLDYMEKVKEIDEEYINEPSLDQIDSEACETHPEGCLDPQLCGLRTALSRNLRRIAGYAVAIADNAVVASVPKFQKS